MPILGHFIKVKGNLKEIQALATQLQIPIEFERNKTEEGWRSKPKGMLQILWERGFIDPSLTSRRKRLYYNTEQNNWVLQSNAHQNTIQKLLERVLSFAGVLQRTSTER